MDIGAVSMMLYGWREREETLRLLEMITGPADEPQLHPPRRASRPTCPTVGRTRCSRPARVVEYGIAEYDQLLTENPIWIERMVGVGVITTEQALALGVTGPILRSTGFAWDLRKAQPYLAYDQVDFDVIYTENGDCFDRYRIRLYEIARVDQDRAPVRRAHARAATTGSRTRRSRPRRGPASTSRWRR